MDVHPPDHPLHTWKDFFIHIATIIVGLLIAIGLEQSVEALHHRHQRQELQQDLHDEAEKNQKIIGRDLHMQDLEAWFDRAMMEAAAAPAQGKLTFALSPPPCITGSVGTAAIRYFAPSEAVWTTAKESGLAALLPVEEARVHARLGHNLELLGGARERVASGCDAITALRRRFAKSAADGVSETWTMNEAQAEKLADAASVTQTAIKGLTFRLRWTRLYEDAIVRDVTEPDEKMMTMNQEEFEDSSGR